MIARMHELATELRQPFFAWRASNARTMLSIMRGATDAEQQLFATFELGKAAGQPDAGTNFNAQLSVLRSDQGRSRELTDAIRATAEAQPHNQAWRAALAHLYCETDRLDEARKVMDLFAATGFAIQMKWNSAVSMLWLASACADLDDRNAAALCTRS
jgi:hypothetical protein